MSLQGEYEHEEGDIDTVPIQITHVQGPQTGPETVRKFDDPACLPGV